MTGPGPWRGLVRTLDGSFSQPPWFVVFPLGVLTSLYSLKLPRLALPSFSHSRMGGSVPLHHQTKHGAPRTQPAPVTRQRPSAPCLPRSPGSCVGGQRTRPWAASDGRTPVRPSAHLTPGSGRGMLATGNAWLPGQLWLSL